MNELFRFYQQRLKMPPYDFVYNPYGFRNATSGSDISAHMPILAFIAKDCNHITEFGTRECYSTSAFLITCPGKVVSYDIKIYPDVLQLQTIVTNDKWQFVQHDTTDPNLEIEPTDFLFIDSLHTYNQVKSELRQSHNVKKYIGFHDTYSQGDKSLDVPGANGINLAIKEFLYEHTNWEIVYQVAFNHGLVIIERKK